MANLVFRSIQGYSHCGRDKQTMVFRVFIVWILHEYQWCSTSVTTSGFHTLNTTWKPLIAQGYSEREYHWCAGIFRLWILHEYLWFVFKDIQTLNTKEYASYSDSCNAWILHEYQWYSGVFVVVFTSEYLRIFAVAVRCVFVKKIAASQIKTMMAAGRVGRSSC